MRNLERYLAECEGRRRRMRDRPSDEVLGEIRTLLERLSAGGPTTRTALDPEPIITDSSSLPDVRSTAADDGPRGRSIARRPD